MSLDSSNYKLVDFPRVLLVTSSAFNTITGTGLLLRNLFSGWPRNRLAMACGEKYSNEDSLCALYYQTGTTELRFYWPFTFMNRAAATGKETGREAVCHPGREKKKSRMVYSALDFLGGAEIVCRKIVSKDLLLWAQKFEPEILYCQSSSLNNIRFVRDLSAALQIPYCIHVMDDWLDVQYRRGLFAPLLRTQYLFAFKQLVENAEVCMGIGQKMCRYYQQKFKKKFLPFSNVVDSEMWNNGGLGSAPKNGLFTIVYAGTINTKNIHNLMAMSSIAEELVKEGQTIHFHIHSFESRAKEYLPVLVKPGAVSVSAVPSTDEGMSKLLQSADMLYLPVDFTQRSIARMKYSIFAKLPAYMLSGTPVLVYGPAAVASVEYAINEKWAYVVEQENREVLKKAILDLKADQELRNRLVSNARNIAMRDFDAQKIRESFRNALFKAAKFERDSA